MDPAGRSGPAILPGCVGGSVRPLGLQLRPRREGPAARRLLGGRVGQGRGRLRRDEESWGPTSSASTCSSASSWTARTSPTRRRSTGWRSCWRWPRRHGLYLDLTGLGCYHKKDVPAWYDKLAETGALGRAGPVLGGGRRPLCREPGRLLLRPDERAGRARRPAQGRRLARPAVRRQALRPVHHARPEGPAAARHRPAVGRRPRRRRSARGRRGT